MNPDVANRQNPAEEATSAAVSTRRAYQSPKIVDLSVAGNTRGKLIPSATESGPIFGPS